MAEVTGSIIGAEGVHDVILNNASTEATLRLILQATLASTKEQKDNISAMAEKMGLDPASIEATNKQVHALGNNSNLLSQDFTALRLISNDIRGSFSALYNTTSKLTSGSGSLADVLTSMSKLPLGIGAVLGAMGQLASFQETLLKSYRSMSDSGANFSGSLTDMRLSASKTYLTLSEFSEVVKANSTTLAKMGYSVKDGTKTFETMSNGLIGSDVGNKLLALGYSTVDINNSLLNFVGTTNNAANSQKGNYKELTDATASYLTELDAITQFTGISRKKLEEDQKKAAEQQAFQRKLASMAPADAAKVKAAYDAASASGIKGATDLVMSTALGLPPMTEAARTLSGVLPDAAAGIVNMTNTAMTHGTTMNDVNDSFIDVMVGAKKNTDALGKSGEALTMMPGILGEVVNSGMSAGNLITAKGIQTAEDGQKAMKNIGLDQIEQQKSQAANAAATEKAVKELGTSILTELMPPIRFLLTILNGVVQGFSAVAKAIVGIPVLFYSLAAGLTVVLGSLAVAKAEATIGALARGYKAGGGGIKGAAKGLASALTKADGSEANPFYVIIKGGSAGSILEDLAGGAPGEPSKPGNKPSGRTGRFGKIGKYLGSMRGMAAVGTVLGGAMTASEIYDLEKELEKNPAKKEEVRKKEGSAIGGFAGGAGGGWAGMTAGAAVGGGAGAAFFGVGAIPGAIVGGLIGAFAGGYVGDKIGSAVGEKVGESIGKSKTDTAQTPENKQNEEHMALLKRQIELMEHQRHLAERQLQHLDDINGNTDGGGFSWARPN